MSEAGPAGAFITPIMVTMVGDVQTGKSYQIAEIFRATDPDGSRPFGRALLITAEGAARVTFADLIRDPHVAHFEATTPEEFTRILEEDFPRGIDGEPFTLVIFDGWSSLQERTKADERVNATSAKIAEDNRVLAARASPRLRNTIAAWMNAASSEAGRGVLFISTCHVIEEWKQRPGSKDINDRVRIGLKMDISDQVFKVLFRDGNAIIYMMRLLPDISDRLTGETMEDFDANLERLNQDAIAGDSSAAPMYFAITRGCRLNGDELRFVKHQDGLFDPDLVKMAWRSPNFGQAFLTSPLRRK